jgi:uncharacterized integral membrane protein (TIGR00698 family)
MVTDGLDHAQRLAPPPWLAGFVAAGAIGVLAVAAGHQVPVVGAPVVAVVGGALLSPLVRRRHEQLAPGIAIAGGRLLQVAVVLLGAQLSLGQVASVGASSLPVMIGTLAVCLGAAYLLGRWLGIPRDLRTLIGVGTAICGASAIAAASPAIKARGNDVAYALSTIFLFNVAAIVAFPPLGHLLGLSQSHFGLFAGTAVNDLSSVVAASSSYGVVAAQHAVVVKLVRTLMIVPIVLFLATVTARRTGVVPPGGRVRRTAGLVPWFLVGFVVVVLANSAGVVPGSVRSTLQQLALLLIAVALAAIGLSTDVAGLRRAGMRPLLLGALLWVLVAATSLGLQAIAT